MRILFTDEYETLNCVIATCIGFDDTDESLWFYTDGQIFSAPFAKPYAEARIEEAYREGKVDLSYTKFTEYQKD